MPAKLVIVETSDPRANEVTLVREAVRAIVLDRDNRVLLFKAFPDTTHSRYFWITPGGGLAAGESATDALRRELAEECGLVAADIGPLIWVREHVFPMPLSGEAMRQRERFYLVRVDRHEVDVSGWDDFERNFMGEHRWWTLSAVQTSDDEFAPHRLGHFLADIVNGRIPTEPIDTGI
jgi:8-oxo-dGTP pyrophosphatase MutT (NUDIX family)